MHLSHPRLLLWCSSVFLACEGGAAGDGGSVEGVVDDVVLDGAKADSPVEDAASPDVPAPESDLTESSPEVAEVTAPAGLTTAWGTITGACGTLGPALASPEPSFHVNTYTFEPGAFDATPLRSLAKKRYSGPNNGGSSKCSEAMSIQTFHDCDGFEGLKTEVEIEWTVVGQTTDWLGQKDGEKYGVSVSRAYQGPTDDTYTVEDATKVLTKKFGGINESTQNVAPADRWKKQLLHVWTLQPSWVPILEQAWNELDPALKADTVVVVTVELGSTAITGDSCADE